MKERPILFSGAMVRALLDGSKTQTRRIVKPPHNNPLGQWEPTVIGGPNGGRTARGETIPEQGGIWHTRTGDSLMCPHGQPGDRLYVRETWAQPTTLDPGPTFYRADYPEAVLGKYENLLPAEAITWKPSIHMPRSLSRITLEVTGVRVERLKDISADDARAEGLEYREDYIAGQLCRRWRAYGSPDSWFPEGRDIAPIHSFQTLWDSLNAERGFGWDENPWVWVVEFRRIECNT